MIIDKIKKKDLVLTIFLVGFIIFLCGELFVYYSPLSSLTCGIIYISDCMSAIGFPAIIFGKWLIATSAILLLARERMIGRWVYFGASFLVISIILIGMTHVSPFWGKDAIATLCGIIFAVVTLFWVVADALIARRKGK